MNAFVLKAWMKETAADIVGARFVSVESPGENVDVIALAVRGGNSELVISADPEAPAMFVSSPGQMAAALPETFADPPESTFARTLNFQIRAAALEEIRQCGWDRQVDFVWAMTSRFGVTSRRFLHFEPMGRASNLYILTECKTVVAVRRRVAPGKSSFRQVVIGRPYPPPPQMKKLTTDDVDENDFYAASTGCEGTIDDMLRREFVGFDRGMTHAFARAVGIEGRECGGLTRAECRDVWRELSLLYAQPARAIALLAGEPVRANDFLRSRFVERARGRTGKPVACTSRERPSPLATQIAALERELARCAAAPEMEESAADIYQAMADVGDDAESRRAFFAELADKHPAARDVLDADESLGKNAQALLAEAARLKRGASEIERRLADLRADGGRREQPVPHTAASVQASTPLDAHRLLFAKLRRQGVRFKVYVSTDGVPVICSENEASNHALYKRLGQTDYGFFHARDYPGAYVILCAGLDDASRSSIEEAAATAAAHSKAGKAAEIDVTYTKMKNLFRFKGARRGQVMLRHEKVIRADAAKFRALEERQTALRASLADGES